MKLGGAYRYRCRIFFLDHLLTGASQDKAGDAGGTTKIRPKTTENGYIYVYIILYYIILYYIIFLFIFIFTFIFIFIFIKGSLDEKLPSYEVLKMLRE